jgi:thiol:disulfide interchange protein DsbD
MGVALGFGLSQSVPVLFAVFLMLGLGLAFPYLLFAVFPSWARILPRPGLWMKYMKQVMALPLMATAGWLFWIFAQMRGPSAWAVVAAGAILLTLALVLTKRNKKAVTAVVGLVLLAGLVFIHRQALPAKELTAHGPWQPYSEEKLKSLKGRNVLVDMTADWCLTCKVNERLVLNQPDVQELLRRKQVVLLQGDWTNRNPEITLFLNRYQRVGVPFYVLYSVRHPDGMVLPEVLVKNSFMELIEKEFQN